MHNPATDTTNEITLGILSLLQAIFLATALLSWWAARKKGIRPYAVLVILYTGLFIIPVEAFRAAGQAEASNLPSKGGWLGDWLLPVWALFGLGAFGYQVYLIWKWKASKKAAEATF